MRTLGDLGLGALRRSRTVAAPVRTDPTAPTLSQAARSIRVVRRRASPEGRVAQGATSLRAFAQAYLGHHFPAGFCDLHEDIFAACDAMNTGHGRRVARIAPRKYGKTTIISMALPLQQLAYQKKSFILMVGESSTTSEANLATISNELDTNHKLREDFPHLQPARDNKGQFVKWTDRQLVFRNYATIMAKGMGSRMRGLKYRQSRPDLAILDDPESPETADTFLKRRRHKRWFGGTFMGLGADGWDIYVIGNLPHHDCLIADLVKSPEWDGRLWRAINIPHRADERYPVGNTDTDGSALWPDMWPLDRLEAYKREPNVGSLGFAREMMNDPREEEDKAFNPSTFEYIDWTEAMLPSYRRVAMAIDPAGGERPGDVRRGVRDWCVIVTGGQTRDGYIDVFDVQMTRGTPDQQMALALDVYATLRPRLISIEDNMFKNLYEPSFARLARERKLYPRIKSTPNTKNKISRILGLQPLIHPPTGGRAVVRFARHLIDRVEQYFAQFDEFPMGFDDGPDATEMLVRALEKLSIVGGISHLPSAGSYWRK